MLKSPRELACTCWRTLAPQTRSTITSVGKEVPSVVATRPVRNITIFSLDSVGCKVVGSEFKVGLLGGGGAGGGLGAGAFCAHATGTRNPAASANLTKVAMPCLTNVFGGKADPITKL